jgi:hypothetical protein
VPDLLEVREYHGSVPRGYGDRWSGTDYDSPSFDRLSDKAAALNSVTLDLSANYSEAFSRQTPVSGLAGMLLYRVKGLSGRDVRRRGCGRAVG